MLTDAPKEPLSWRPKRLDFQEARDLHDYESIEQDLMLSKSCFDSVSSLPHGVVFTPKLFAADEKGRTDWCAFVCGGIYYRRCFKSGVRGHLQEDEVEKFLDSNQISLHGMLINIIDKHVAHSVNEMELGCTTLHVAFDSKGNLQRGGIGSQNLTAGPFSASGFKAISSMISLILDQVVTSKIVSLKIAVRHVIDSMADDEIRQLPEGFPPHIDNLRCGSARNWPPRN